MDCAGRGWTSCPCVADLEQKKTEGLNKTTLIKKKKNRDIYENALKNAKNNKNRGAKFYKNKYNFIDWKKRS